MDFSQALEIFRRRIAELLEFLKLPGADETPEIRLEAADIHGQLESHRSGLFLGIHDEATITDALERLGVLPAVRGRVGADVRIRLLPEEGILRAYRADRPEGPDALLVELKARLEKVAPEPLRTRGFPEGEYLVVEWILLQDPGRPFPPGRRPFPGQSHPGLGVGPRVLDAIVAAARRLGAVAVIAIPAYYHAAVLYHRAFVFANPVSEARFQALSRDLAAHGLDLSEASAAVHGGRVRDATFDEPYAWVGDEMVLPLAPAVRDHLADKRYLDAAARALLGTRFTVAAR